MTEMFPADGAGGVTRLEYARRLRVLLVEDDERARDQLLLAAGNSVLDVHVDVASSVDAAVAVLRRDHDRSRTPEPDLVLCSLDDRANQELLTVLAASDDVVDVPVIVLSDSPTAEVERRVFALGAAAHLSAPTGDSERLALVHALPDYVPRARAAHVELESNQR